MRILQLTLYGTLFALCTFLGFSYAPVQTYSAALPSATAVFETSLQSAITSSATTMTLTANAIRGGGSLSGYNCFTVDEGSAQAETICGTVSATTVSSLTRGVSQSTGTTTVAALQFAHRRGANVKITDFPIIQILKAQANGEDTFPQPIFYKDTVLIGVGYATTTIVPKYYVDQQVAAGCSFADSSTKGCVETATAREAASSTILGSTLSALVLPASIATDTPQLCSTPSLGGCVVMTQLTGKIRQTFLNLTEQYSWTGHHIFTSHFSTIASTTNATTTTFAITGTPSTILKTSSTGVIQAAVSNTDYRAIPFAQDGTVQTSSGTATSTITIVVPANTYATSKNLRLEVYASCSGTNDTKGYGIDVGTGLATTTLYYWTRTGSCANSVSYTRFHMVINSTSAQSYTVFSDGEVAGATAGPNTNGLLSLTTTNQTYIAIKFNAKNAGDTATLRGYTAQIY